MMLLCMNGMTQCLDRTDDDYRYHLRDISIEGASNVNTFAFWYENPLQNNSSGEDEGCYPEKDTCMVDFNIQVNLFKGSNPVMRNDFLTLLKASEYPEIIVGIEKNTFDCIATGVYTDKMAMVITLAGTKKAVHADYSAYTGKDNRIIVSGQTKFLLTDFKLNPPEKALGLVRVQNEVFIKFDIIISSAGIDSNQALN